MEREYGMDMSEPVERIKRLAQTFEMLATPEQRKTRDEARDRVLYGEKYARRGGAVCQCHNYKAVNCAIHGKVIPFPTGKLAPSPDTDH